MSEERTPVEEPGPTPEPDPAGDPAVVEAGASSVYVATVARSLPEF